MNKYYYGLSIYSIQEYIFETNKLKEIIGASEIVEMVCKTAFQEQFSGFLKEATILLQAAGNVRCLFSIDDANLAAFKKSYAEFSKILTLAYPELKFCQAIHCLEDHQEITKENIDALDKALTTKKQQPVSYPRLAFMGVQRNQHTGKIQSSKNNNYDLATLKKNANNEGEMLLQKLHKINATFPKDLEEIASEQSYIALIHIDTNGLGDFIKTLAEQHQKSEALKEFSSAVESATINAVTTAIQETFSEQLKELQTIPFRPVLIGGDDITIIIKAEKALDFTKAYITAFEENTKEINVTKGKGFTACAGIAFTKQKFPLHYTADLVESLCKSAKDGSDRKYSAIRMHRVRNTYAHDYDRIKDTELSLKGKTVFHNKKPFDIDELTQFQKDVLIINKDDFPRADLENYLSQLINGNPQAAFLKKRMEAKLPKSEIAFIQNMKTAKLDLPYLYNLINLKKLANS